MRQGDRVILKSPLDAGLIIVCLVFATAVIETLAAGLCSSSSSSTWAGGGGGGGALWKGFNQQAASQRSSSTSVHSTHTLVWFCYIFLRNTFSW